MSNNMFAVVSQDNLDNSSQNFTQAILNTPTTDENNLDYEANLDFDLAKLQKLPLDQYLKSLEIQIDQLQELFLTKLLGIVEAHKISLDSKLTISLDANGSITVNGEKAICELFNQELSSSLRQIAIKALLARALEQCQKANNLSNLSSHSHEKIFQLCLKGNLAHSFLVD